MLNIIFSYIRIFLSRVRILRIALANSSIGRGKVVGLSHEALIGLWLSVHLPYGYYVSMTDINFAEREVDFWIRLPKHVTKQFIYSDIVILSVRDLREADNIMESIPEAFAKATLFKGPEVMYTNHNNLVEKI